MKIPFDIKFRPQIESGEYKVFAHEHDGQEARIVCWDNKGKYPIVALVDDEPEKFDKYGRVPGGNRGGEFSLFIITPEPELSEFEEAVGSEIFDPPFNEEQIKVIREESAKLLELAKEELQEKVIHDYWEQAADRCVQAREEGRAEALKEIEQDPESSYAFKRGVEYGKEEALKDLPRWKRAAASFGNYSVAPTDTGQLCLLIDGYYIMLSDLKKLPGFNE